MPNLMSMRLVGAELFHAGGLTYRHTYEYMTKLIVAFRSFANAPRNIVCRSGHKCCELRITRC